MSSTDKPKKNVEQCTIETRKITISPFKYHTFPYNSTYSKAVELAYLQKSTKKIQFFNSLSVIRYTEAKMLYPSH